VARERSGYLSYLLRLWRVKGKAEDETVQGKEVWRASLESARTRELRLFRTVDELFNFLRGETSPDIDDRDS
jgi:hypothetical protein